MRLPDVKDKFWILYEVDPEPQRQTAKDQTQPHVFSARIPLDSLPDVTSSADLWACSYQGLSKFVSYRPYIKKLQDSMGCWTLSYSLGILVLGMGIDLADPSWTPIDSSYLLLFQVWTTSGSKILCRRAAWSRKSNRYLMAGGTELSTFRIIRNRSSMNCCKVPCNHNQKKVRTMLKLWFKQYQTLSCASL